MAFEGVEIPIGFVGIEKAVSQLNDLTKTGNASVAILSNGFKALAVTAVAALGGIGFAKMVESASEADQAVQRLNTALKVSGDFTDEASKHFQDLASSIERTANIQDESILGLVAQGKALGQTNKQTEDLVRASVDLSKVLDTDVNTAFNELSRTLNGQVARGLQQRFPELKNLTTEALLNGEAVQLLGKRFKGAAEELSNTFGGALAGTKIGFGNIFEELGKAVTQNPQVVQSLNGLKLLFNELADVIKDNREAIGAFVSKGINAMVDAFAFLTRAIKPVVEGFGFIEKAITTITANAAIAAGQLQVFFGNKSLKQGAAEYKAIEDAAAQAFVTIDERTAKTAKVVDTVTKSTDRYVEFVKKAAPAVSKLANADIKASQIKNELLREQIELQQRLVKEQLNALAKGAAANPFDFLVNMDEKLQKFADQKDANGRKFVTPSQVDQARQQGTASAGLGIANQVLSGPQGAAQALGAGLGALADTVLPGLGALVSTITQVLAQGPEAARAFITGIIEGIPSIIENVLLSIPVVIETLAEKAPDIAVAIISTIVENAPEIAIRVATSLSNQMPVVATRMAVEFVKKVPEMVKGLVEGIVSAIKEALGKLTGGIGEIGGGIGGLFGSVAGGAGKVAGKIGKVFGFSEGGIVPGGAPFVDRVPAALTPGEEVLTGTTSEKLDQVLNMMSGGGRAIQLTTIIKVGEQELARTIQSLNERGFRLA